MNLLSSRVEMLRRVLEKEAASKGYGNPEVIKLSQVLDHYISEALKKQLRDYRLQGAKNRD